MELRPATRRAPLLVLGIALAATSAALGGAATGSVSPAPAGLPGAVPRTDTGPARGAADPATSLTELPGADWTTRLTSRNWDGYTTYDAGHTTDFTGVTATWVQPTVTCGAPSAWTVFWVGLDGTFTDDVEQGGSEAQCGRVGGAPTYSLWWEMYPATAIETTVPIHAGDTVTATVTYKPAAGRFVIDVQDDSTGVSLVRHELCPPGTSCVRNSAEVITEDVGSGAAYFPLADYGTVGYSTVAVTDSAGQQGPLSDPDWLDAPITESAGHVDYATVSLLSEGGTAFSTTFKHA